MRHGVGTRVIIRTIGLGLGTVFGLLAGCSQFSDDEDSASTFQLAPLTTTTTVPPSTTTFPNRYVVQDGDTMDAIASRLGVPLPALIAANLNLPTPDYIQPGWVLKVPPPPSTTTTTLAPG
jgi:LysM repeat protein